MRTRTDIIRIHRPLKQMQMLPILLIALALVVPLRRLSAAAFSTTESTIVPKTAGAPFLPSTPEVLNKDGNGAGRIVYNIPGEGSFDVYAASFQMPVVTEDQVDVLVVLIGSFNLPPESANLVTRLRSAQASIDASDMPTACSYLAAFTTECAAQARKQLTTNQATQLINSANLIKTNHGCS